MLNIRFIIFLVFFLLTLCNMFDFISITMIGVFGMTVGAIFITLGEIFESEAVRNIYYITGATFIGVSPFLKDFKLINDLVSSVDSNTLMLVSITALFLSIYVNHDIKKNK